MQITNICQVNFSSYTALKMRTTCCPQGPPSMRVWCQAADNQNAPDAGNSYPMALVGTSTIQGWTSYNAPAPDVFAAPCTGRRNPPPLIHKATHSTSLPIAPITQHCTMPPAPAPQGTLPGSKKTVFDKIYSACKNLAIFQTACRAACIVCPEHWINNRRAILWVARTTVIPRKWKTRGK